MYSYVSGDTSESGECHADYDNFVATIRGYEVLPGNDMEVVMRHLAEIGMKNKYMLFSGAILNIID